MINPIRYIRKNLLIGEGSFGRWRNFDWTAFLYRRESVGGLAVSEKGVSLTFLPGSGSATTKTNPVRKDGLSNGAHSEPSLQKDIALPPGTIERGELKDKTKLAAAFKELQSGLKLPSRSVVVSLPVSVAQPFIFEFFPNLKPAEIADAIAIIIDSALPLPADKIYTDWEEIGVSEFKKRKFLLAMGVKDLIAPYLDAIKQSGLTPIALETHGWSLGRALDLGGEPSLVVQFEPTELNFLVYQNNTFVFQFNLPRNKGKGEDVNFFKQTADLAERILHFLLSDNEYGFTVAKILFLDGANDREAFLNALTQERRTLVTPELGSNSRLAALGAARRGLLARRQDTISSLMAIGTELAYERSRLISFLGFEQKLIIALGGFFILLFTGTLLLVNILSRNFVRSLSSEELLIPKELPAIKETAQSFNAATLRLSSILKRTPHWENLFSEVDKLINPGLVITGLEVSANAPGTMNGLAKSRDSLLQLRATLQSSETFAPITLPLGAFLAKENIPFSISLQLRDKEILFK